MIYEYQADRFYTPASNTKLYTFYSAIHLLGDSIPAFTFLRKNDSLIIRGTGDPTFLHPDFPSNSIVPFLANQPGKLFIDTTQSIMLGFGPGWSWDDYAYAYSCERSNFPVHGNFARLWMKPSMRIYPTIFRANLSQKSIRTPRRDRMANHFFYPPSVDGLRNEYYDLPIIPYPHSLREILIDTLKRPIDFLTAGDSMSFDSVKYSLHVDTVYQRMLQESDNFLAEQLLILCANNKFGSPDIRPLINWTLDSLLADLPHRPRWVDGSGLSRFNLFSPMDNIVLLEKLYNEVETKRLFALLPAGGESGTLKDNYKGDPAPFIYAKTGTLSNNHNISGYLITDSGKILIFSVMNNHYMTSSREVKKEMEILFNAIRKRG